MYAARYGDGSKQFSQVLVRFPVVLFEPEGKPQRWFLGLRNAVEHLLAAPDVDFAFRIGVAGKRIERALLIIIPTTREDELSSLTAPFLQCNRVADNSVDFCLTREEHDATLQGFPRFRIWVRNESHQLGEQELACDFRIGPEVPKLLGAALQQNWEVALQINARRFHPPPDDLRAVRKNLVRLEAERGVPATVVEHEREIVARLATAQFLVDQFLGAGAAPARDFLLRWLEEHFAAKYGRLGFPAGPFDVDSESALEAPIITGFHSCLFHETSPMNRAAMAVDQPTLMTYLAWRPPEGWHPTTLANAVLERESEADIVRRMEQRLQRIEVLLDSRKLNKHTCEEFRKALQIHRADPPFALVKARQILEEIIKRVYQAERKTREVKPLFNMIEELIQVGTVFPRNIASYLHSVRVLGNLAVHSGPDAAPAPLSGGDLELSLLMTLHAVEWYLTDYTPRNSAHDK